MLFYGQLVEEQHSLPKTIRLKFIVIAKEGEGVVVERHQLGRHAINHKNLSVRLY